MAFVINIYFKIHYVFISSRTADSPSRAAPSSTTRDCRTVRLTTTPSADRCAPAAPSRSPGAALRPCLRNSTRNTLSAPSASSSWTREPSRSRRTSHTATSASTRYSDEDNSQLPNPSYGYKYCFLYDLRTQPNQPKHRPQPPPVHLLTVHLCFLYNRVKLVL